MVWLWVSQREVKTAREDWYICGTITGLDQTQDVAHLAQRSMRIWRKSRARTCKRICPFLLELPPAWPSLTCVLPFRRSVVQKEKKQLVESDIGLICSGGTGTQNILWSLCSILLSSFTLLTRESPANSGSSSRF